MFSSNSNNSQRNEGRDETTPFAQIRGFRRAQTHDTATHYFSSLVSSRTKNSQNHYRRNGVATLIDRVGGRRESGKYVQDESIPPSNILTIQSSGVKSIYRKNQRRTEREATKRGEDMQEDWPWTCHRPRSRSWKYSRPFHRFRDSSRFPRLPNCQYSIAEVERATHGTFEHQDRFRPARAGRRPNRVRSEFERVLEYSW